MATEGLETSRWTIPPPGVILLPFRLQTLPNQLSIPTRSFCRRARAQLYPTTLLSTATTAGIPCSCVTLEHPPSHRQAITTALHLLWPAWRRVFCILPTTATVTLLQWTTARIKIGSPPPTPLQQVNMDLTAHRRGLRGPEARLRTCHT